MLVDNNFYMSLALKEAWKYQGLTYPNPAVGCTVIGSNGEILSVEAHHKAGTPHAEVNALKSAYIKLTNDETALHVENSADIHNFLIKNHNNIFENCSIYTTLEPCSSIGKTPACASLIKELKIKKVYIGSSDSYQDDFKNAQFSILKKECDDLLEPFNLWKKDKFVFFKWAQRLDGSTDGTVSSIKSRTNVHAMRDVCDLLVVGGNTVREDRPTLDARLVDGKAPNILIYSREKEFDKNIALFNVPNRKVIISDNLDEINNYKNIMIEGTHKMMELTNDVVNFHLCYLHVEDKFDILNKEKEDIISWMKKRK